MKRILSLEKDDFQAQSECFSDMLRHENMNFMINLDAFISMFKNFFKFMIQKVEVCSYNYINR